MLELALINVLEPLDMAINDSVTKSPVESTYSKVVKSTAASGTPFVDPVVNSKLSSLSPPLRASLVFK